MLHFLLYHEADDAERVGYADLTKRTTPQAWQFLNSPQKNRWSALRAASEKAARQGDRFRFSSILVQFYQIARTYSSTKN